MKKKVILAMAAMFCTFSAFAQINEEEQNLDVNEDVTDVVSLDDIIQGETTLSKYKGDEEHYKQVWGRNTFFNISYNTTDMTGKQGDKSLAGYNLDKKELKLKKNFGVGLQWGHTYNFHKKAIGDVLFIGLDYTWMDLNVNKFDKDTTVVEQKRFEQTYFEENNVYANAPFHNSMWEIDYGMSIGPSLTFYPFTALHKNGTDNIRLQFYFHVGYNVSAMLMEKCIVKNDSKGKTCLEYGHGLFTSYGGNLTWRNIGIGYEVRNISKSIYRPLMTEYFDDKLENEFSQKMSRVYLQFRY